jgi:hypothetical protein
MKLTFTLSRLECGVQYLSIGLLGQFSSKNTVNMKHYTDTLHEFFRHTTEEETAEA